MKVINDNSNNNTSPLPKGWVWTRLGEVNEVIMGQSPPSDSYNNEKIGLPFYQGKAEFGDVYPSPVKWCSKPIKIAEKNDILISVRAPVGPTNICYETSCIGRGLAAIRYHVKDGYKFLFYYLRLIQPYIANIGTGSTFSAISKSQIENLQIPLPPLPEQHRIVAKIEELFTKLDAGVEALKKIKAQIKRYRQAVLKYAFEGKLTEHFRESHKGQLEPASILLERIKEQRKKEAKGKYKELPPIDTTNLPELPEGWVWVRVGEIIEVVRGSSPRPKGDPRYFGGDIPWIMISDVSKEKSKYISKTKDTVTEEGKRKSRFLKAGTLILSNSGTVCVPKILAVDGCIHDGFVAFPNLSDKIEINYCYYYFEYIRPKIIQENKQGVTQVNLNTEIIRNINIILPPLAEQHKIVEEIERRFSIADSVEKIVDQSLKQAERLRQSILKRAFEGKLVPQDPNDEPAEKLLERIKAERAIHLSSNKPKKKNILDKQGGF